MSVPRLLSAHGKNHPGILPVSAFDPLPERVHNYPLLGFKDIYSTVGVIGIRFADRARDLAGEPVRIRGYMAPPEFDKANFFVLTRAPVIACPFCDPGRNWPDDAVLALLECDSPFVDPGQQIEIVGELELGPKTDIQTAASLKVRLRDAIWQPIVG